MTEIEDLIKSGKIHLDEENYNDALSFFEQALSLEPENPDLWNLKGMVLRSLGRYDEALDCYNKSLDIDPRDNASS
jgi:Flp pilus assembly protein TadD|tara:strand:- start:3011 stop:3238 length:228 start_codon:yes stop_codon:yes gene_type:complete